MVSGYSRQGGGLGDNPSPPGYNRDIKVLFVSPSTEQINMTLPSGLVLVAAATRRSGDEARFLDLLP